MEKRLERLNAILETVITILVVIRLVRYWKGVLS